MPGHEDDRKMDAQCGKLGLEVEPAETRQSDIEDEAAGNVRKLPVKELQRSTPRPTERNRAPSASRTETSSSTMKTTGLAGRANVLPFVIAFMRRLACYSVDDLAEPRPNFQRHFQNRC
jgi:hypothetical protein